MTRIKSWDYQIIGPDEIVKCHRCGKRIRTIAFVIERESNHKSTYHVECLIDDLIDEVNDLHNQRRR